MKDVKRCVYCGKTEEEVKIKDVMYSINGVYNNICYKCFNHIENKREEA